MNSFSLSFAVGDDGESILIVSLDTGDFKGRCLYWCPPTEFVDLMTTLKSFPITRENPIDLCWYGGCIAVRIEPINSVGRLSLHVSLQDYTSDWNRCQSEFHASYGDLDRFRDQLEAVVAHGAGDATLSSS